MNGIGYAEDPYERKQDISRDEYARLNNKILDAGNSFKHVVRQHGTFYPNILTFGTTKDFPEKKADPRFVPKYGAWKRGDDPHTGHNKTFGGHGGRSTEYNYVEEQEQDTIRIKQEPIWRTTAQMTKTMASNTGMLV